MDMAPANLPALVRAAFARARASGDVLFFPTQVALLSVGGAQLQLRFAPSLASKPKPDPKLKSSPTTDPFADPPAALLVVPQLGPAHRLVLNKYAVSADHAILTTADFAPQHHLLEAADLAAAHACIAAYHAQNESLFVFYNSGAHSGASQPHRHLQLLPVAQMRAGLADADADRWDVLVDRIADGSVVPPFRVATARLAAKPTPSELHETYLRLYRAACTMARGTMAVVADGDGDGDGETDTRAEEAGHVPARISYNLALTHATMAVLPRVADGAALDGGGYVGLNGTVLAGTALVKDEATWDALRSRPEHLQAVLASIGVSA